MVLRSHGFEADDLTHNPGSASVASAADPDRAFLRSTFTGKRTNQIISAKISDGERVIGYDRKMEIGTGSGFVKAKGARGTRS